jgi:hypothetical protein
MEVSFAGYLAQWACSAVRLQMQWPVKLFSLGFCHQNNFWVVISVPYFFTLLYRHGNTCGPTQDNRLQAVKPRVSVWKSSSFIRKEEVKLTCLRIWAQLPDTYASVARCPHLILYIVVCTSGRSAHVLTNAKFSMVTECCMAS